ncbi:hypothetical protein SAMN04488691_103109 [Haloferax larsenii]|uniref:Uncharacterized protein n=2 Tax=Haloferax larsenii TaxID=302484 RepID=A0A1H7MW47_HALLR|nr:hypothetical protein SAMN04488691_103109 [Haloferax larsenii]
MTFNYVLIAGVVAAATNTGVNYVKTGELALVEAGLQILLVVVFGALLVTYWNYMERRAESE